MALDSTATLVVGAGNFFTAPYDSLSPAALPLDLSVTPAAPWVNMGHTSLEDIFSVASEGGEATTLGTLQANTLRTIYSPRTETFNLVLQQFDEASLRLYFGANATVGANGELQVPSSPDATVSSFLAIFVDGTNQFAFYAPKAEILRGDDMAISDTESLAGLPISIKPVAHGTNEWNYAVTPLGAV
jgi:hypothetical protein